VATRSAISADITLRALQTLAGVGTVIASRIPDHRRLTERYGIAAELKLTTRQRGNRAAEDCSGWTRAPSRWYRMPDAVDFRSGLQAGCRGWCAGHALIALPGFVVLMRFGRSPSTTVFFEELSAAEGDRRAAPD